MKNKYNDKEDRKPHTTKYGEMVPSNFGWISIGKQKEIADKLANVTKETKSKD